jgi:hypothetical protein
MLHPFCTAHTHECTAHEKMEALEEVQKWKWSQFSCSFAMCNDNLVLFVVLKNNFFFLLLLMMLLILLLLLHINCI